MSSEVAEGVEAIAFHGVECFVHHLSDLAARVCRGELADDARYCLGLPRFSELLQVRKINVLPAELYSAQALARSRRSLGWLTVVSLAPGSVLDGNLSRTSRARSRAS